MVMKVNRNSRMVATAAERKLNCCVQGGGCWYSLGSKLSGSVGSSTPYALFSMCHSVAPFLYVICHSISVNQGASMGSKRKVISADSPNSLANVIYKVLLLQVAK